MSTAQTGKRLIDYIRFDTSKDNDLYRITLWFNDSRFRAQYNYYDIVVIPPVDNLDRLIIDMPTTAIALQSTHISTIVDQIGYYNRANKATNVVSYTLAYHDPTEEDKDTILDTTWTIIMYGTMAEDTESIKAAIRDYLTAHSNYDDWHVIFPALYSTNEFIVIPFWDNLITPDDSYDEGWYSTIVSMDKVRDVTRDLIPSSYRVGKMSDKYIGNTSMIGSAYYRSIPFLSLGSPSNTDQKNRITDLYPDYMAVSTDSPDFARMSTKTQNFILTLNDCLNKARLYTSSETIPEGFTRGIKGGRTYIGFDSDGYTFYIITRQGYMRDL